jgi:hypothetical protein
MLGDGEGGIGEFYRYRGGIPEVDCCQPVTNPSSANHRRKPDRHALGAQQDTLHRFGREDLVAGKFAGDARQRTEQKEVINEYE